MGRLLISLLLVTFLIAGCGGGFFSSGIDSKRDEHGNTILLDTPNNWENWILYMDLHISDELSRKQVPGGGGLGTTWEEFWQQLIRDIDDGHQENPQKYINYIIERRREVGINGGINGVRINGVRLD